MRINNNLMAMNAHRQLGANQTAGAKSMERLTSGLRINRAGDDAAGLAISEKMRGQIRGLNQASRNAQDGISLIQTAEGALNETHSILQRMRELAVQSSNDTNIAVDRNEIQKEIDQLAQEITRVANNTEFNQQTLLNGGITKNGLGEVKFHIGANKGQDINLAINAMDAASLGVARDVMTASLDDENATGITKMEVSSTTTLVEGTHAVTVSDVAATNAEATLAGDVKLVTKGALAGAAGEGVKVTISDTGTAGATWDSATNTLAITTDGGTTKADVQAGLAAGGSSVTDLFELSGGADGDSALPGGGEVTLTGGADAALKFTIGSHEQTVATDATTVKFSELGLTLTKDATATAQGDFSNVNITVTADKARAASVVGDGTMSEAVAKAGINVSTQETASAAITTINNAIETVSAERSKLGAYQNRLEHTISNLGTSAENLQAAESRIRDVDMAAEMMDFTKANILNQAATAMLAQANQAPQSVLQLLG